MNPQPEGPSLSPEQAKILLKADLANLEKKVNNGKPLSSKERTFLQSSLAGGKVSTAEFVNNIVELAEILGVSRKTIQRWRELDDCPEPRPDGRWHVPAWRTFKLMRQGKDTEDDDNQVTQSQARAKQILLQNERLAMRILAEKKELIPKTIAQQIFSKLILAAKTRSFSSITRFVTLARMSPDSNTAAEEIRKEMILIWKELEDGKWRK